MASVLRPPPAGFYLLAALAAYWALLIYQLGAQWSAYEQYNYGWAVPFLCTYLLWRRLPKSEGKGRVEDGGQRGLSNCHLPSSIFFLLFAPLALLWSVARWLHEANPIWRLTSLVLALLVVAMTLLLVPSIREALRQSRQKKPAAPTSIATPPPADSTTDYGVRTLDVAFPVCFFLLAVPWPTGLENLVTQSFMRANVGLTTELLGLVGIPAMPKGNVIEIASGLVGVDEACSGIRSFQATLMISLFLGELYRLSILRRSLLCFAGFALAFVFNLGRTFLLVTVASRDGVAAIAKWHDPAGITILVGCFLGLWLIGLALRGKRPSPPRMGKGLTEVSDLRPSDVPLPHPGKATAGPSLAPVSAVSPQSSASHLTSLAVCLALWFIFTEIAVEWWYRSQEQSVGDHPNWSLNFGEANPAYTRVKFSPNILGQFGADESTNVQWRDRDGHFWQLFYFRWLPTQSLKRRIAVQLAKTHGPVTCLPAAGMKLKSDLGNISVRVGDLDLVFEQYEFTTDGRSVHVFYAIYEDPTGGTVLANRRQGPDARVAAAMAGSRNYGQRFLEIAVSGYDDTAGARAGVVEQLAKIISQKSEFPRNGHL